MKARLSASPGESSTMDDKTKTRPQDSSRVNTNEDYEVRYWTTKFGCTKEQLQAAVNKVRVSVAAVEQQLKGKSTRAREATRH